MFEKNYTIKWHDTDAFRRVRPTQLLVYMQETSNYHMMSCGPSLDTLRDKCGFAFILRKTRIEIYGDLFAFDEITVQTWTSESRAYALPRYFRILRGNDVIAQADTQWALIDINTKQLVSAKNADVYSFVHGEAPQIDVPQRFKLPKEATCEFKGERSIVYSDLDYNIHMNNTRYADMLCDFLPIEEVLKIGGIFMSYVKEAAFGDTLKIKMYKEDNERFFTAENQKGETCLEALIILSKNSSK